MRFSKRWRMAWTLAAVCLLQASWGSEVFFSPGGGIRDQIIRRINLSRTSIDIAVYSFTSAPMARALVDARHRGVRIRIVRDLRQASDKHDENAYLLQNGIAVKLLSGKGSSRRGYMHHKFAIFDNKIVETGSFNWTVNGERYSHENALFFDDPELIHAFRQEFEKLWNEAHS